MDTVAIRAVLVLTVATLLIPSLLYAQTSTGSASCGGQECHTKSGEIDWLQSKPGGQEHRASLGKMRQAKDNSEKYAKAVNLTNFEDPKGMCVKCHANFVPKGLTLEGVGCEGCHGPASGYRQFHADNTKDYQGAVAKGLRNLQRKPAAWIGVCRDCHVLTNKPEYATLLEDGHKDGARWNVSRKYEGVAFHWKKAGPAYTPALIAAAAAGKPVDVAAPAPAAPAPAPAAAPPAPATPAAAAPVTPTAPPPVSPARPAPARTERPGSVPPAAPVAAPVAVAPPPPPPMAGGSPPVVASPLALSMPPAVTASGLIAALQDRVAGLLESLLRRNAVPPVPLKSPNLSPQVTGPDAEFLRLQSEALALAVEVLNLRAKPADPSTAKPAGSAPPK